MADRLICQSIGGDPRDNFRRYMALEEPIHRDYAARCGADYEYFVGTKDPLANPTWNRLVMMLDAFAAGYEQVAWLDADVLVVQLDRNIFEEVVGAPLHMTRTQGFPWWTPDGEQEAWNDGVLVAERCDESIAALEWVWARRHDPFLAHHVPSMPELTWLLDYVFTQPASLVKELPDIWNFMPWEHTKHRAHEAVIEAWHGQPHDERWENFRTRYEQVYGA